VSRGTPPWAAMCILRVERQGEDRVLITVTSTFDVSLSSPRHPQSVTRSDEALALVADFLRECEHSKNFSSEP
jgi:hypothetical protein